MVLVKSQEPLSYST